MDKKKFIRYAALSLFVVLSVVLAALAYRIYRNNGIESLEHLVSSMGIWGIAVILLMQIMQVVFAVIPGEPIELVMGALYGTVGGAALCLAGAFVGSLLIYTAVAFFGKSKIGSLTDSEKFEKRKFLKNPAKRDMLVFLLMFIPGTPKDLLTYFAPFTGMGAVKFLIISTIARIPSVITSTYVGSTFADGAYKKSVIVFAIVGAVSLLGIYIYNKIVERKNKSETKSDTDKQN